MANSVPGCAKSLDTAMHGFTQGGIPPPKIDHLCLLREFDCPYVMFNVFTISFFFFFSFFYTYIQFCIGYFD